MPRTIARVDGCAQGWLGREFAGRFPKSRISATPAFTWEPRADDQVLSPARLFNATAGRVCPAHVTAAFNFGSDDSVGLFCDQSPESRSTLDAMPSSWTRSLVNRGTILLQHPPFKPHCVYTRGSEVIYCGSATIIQRLGHV